MTRLDRPAGAQWSTLPPRTRPMPGPKAPMVRGPWLSSRSGGSKPRPNPGHARNGTSAEDNGFTREQRLAVRKRAGNGVIEDACCEMCGRWLGRYEGQVHHRQNRQMGGSRLRNRLSNALLACGTPFTWCHGKATIGVGAVRRAMQAMGFVLEAGQDPASEPVMLHGTDGGVTVLLDDLGNYMDAEGNILAGPPLLGGAS